MAFPTALSALLPCLWALPWQHTLHLSTPPIPGPAHRSLQTGDFLLNQGLWLDGALRGWTMARPGSASPPAVPELPRPLSQPPPWPGRVCCGQVQMGPEARTQLTQTLAVTALLSHWRGRKHFSYLNGLASGLWEALQWLKGCVGRVRLQSAGARRGHF